MKFDFTKNIFALCLICIGFTSMSCQIVLMRELLSIFYGNEMTIGFALFAWLFWVSFGSWMMGRAFIDRIKNEKLAFSVVQSIFALSLPVTCLFIRAIPEFFNLTGTRIAEPSLVFLLSLSSLSVVCMLGGFLFIFAFRLLSAKLQEKHTAIGKAYILEAMGAALGGLVVSFILIHKFAPLRIFFLLSIINLFLAFIIGFKHRFQAAVSLFLLITACFIFLFKIPALRDYSLGLRWPNQKLIYSTDTTYSNIAVTDYEDSLNFYLNGLLSFSVPDIETAERLSHFPVSQHPNPGRVLVIGGGPVVLNELLKYGALKIDYVELDPKIIELSLGLTGQKALLEEKRISFLTNIDARLFVKKTSRTYDIVILNLPQPQTTLLNRFYTMEFFKEAEHILSEEGVLSFSLNSNPNYISREQKNLYLCLEGSLKAVFEDVLITPGANNFFFACKKKNILTADWRELISRLQEREIKTLYFREYYLFDELSRERVIKFKNLLQAGGPVPLNLDFRPVGYFYDIILYASFFKYNLSLFLKKINKIRVIYLFLTVYALLLAAGFTRKKRAKDFGILTCVATTGFSEMMFQIIILFAFQVIYGYVYYKLSIIFSFFMAGLITGSCAANSIIARQKAQIGTFIKIQALVCLYPLILPLVFVFFKNSRHDLIFFIGSTLIFPLLPLIAGFIGGFQFPLANELYLRQTRTATKIAAVTYGLDLLGASLAAILVAVILIPVLGVFQTCVLAAVLNTAGLILIIKN